MKSIWGAIRLSWIREVCTTLNGETASTYAAMEGGRCVMHTVKLMLCTYHLHWLWAMWLMRTTRIVAQALAWRPHTDNTGSFRRTFQITHVFDILELFEPQKFGLIRIHGRFNSKILMHLKLLSSMEISDAWGRRHHLLILFLLYLCLT